jgi:hypothetical protein
MMFVTIRHDAQASWDTEATVHSGRSLTAALGDIPGFISCALLDTGDSGMVSIVICEDTTGLEGARHLLDGWLEEHLTRSPHHAATTLMGEVIVQRGL